MAASALPKMGPVREADRGRRVSSVDQIKVELHRASSSAST
jgi:hypothetical protein